LDNEKGKGNTNVDREEKVATVIIKTLTYPVAVVVAADEGNTADTNGRPSGQPTTETVLAFEIDGTRFYASSTGGFVIHPVPTVPPLFERFLISPVHAGQYALRWERDLLSLLYGYNEMLIDIPSVWEITIRHSLNPIILFAYFAIVIWTLQAYYYWVILIALGILMHWNLHHDIGIHGKPEEVTRAGPATWTGNSHARNSH